MNNHVRETVIIGSGCAGLTAAIYAARANLKPLVLQGHEPGGQLSLTTLVENFPGFPEGIHGPELIENMKKQATRFGTEFHTGHVVHADLSRRPFVLDLGRETIHTRTLIVASGASARWLGRPMSKHSSDTASPPALPVMGSFFRERMWRIFTTPVKMRSPV